MSPFANRLAKNAKHRHKWAKRRGLSAYRLYDLDMPDMPAAVDWYAGYAHVALYPRRNAEQVEADARAGVIEGLELPPDRVFVKVHRRQVWGEEQYERVANSSVKTVVEEAGAKLEVNLSDYLDTGLFLDHRETRLKVRAEAKGKRVLNLFAYTGAFSVQAGLGGAASTTTVDLSVNYCDWARHNLALNGLKGEVIAADVFEWLDRARGEYDLIVLDPPSFSASKKARRFDVQKDHPRLIDAARARLAKGGALYFSTNFQSFELDPSIDAEEITLVPEDFRHALHRCWLI
ncbi:MAG: class I SAM-dependent methyltransferase [Myxococcaceae bacterium]